MTIERILYCAGLILIIGGLIGGIASFATIDRENYDLAKEVAEELYDNEIAQAEYQALKSIYQADLTMSLSILFGGIISGLFCLGFAKVLANQERTIELIETTKTTP